MTLKKTVKTFIVLSILAIVVTAWHLYTWRNEYPPWKVIVNNHSSTTLTDLDFKTTGGLAKISSIRPNSKASVQIRHLHHDRLDFSFVDPSGKVHVHNFWPNLRVSPDDTEYVEIYDGYEVEAHETL